MKLDRWKWARIDKTIDQRITPKWHAILFIMRVNCDKERCRKNRKSSYTLSFHATEWTALGTNSASAKGLNGFPMVNVISMADSKRGAPSTGDIYFLLTNLDFTGQDLMKSNRVTMLFSRDQNLECRKQQIDPMEPTCSRVMISGQAIMVTQRLNAMMMKYCYKDFILDFLFLQFNSTTSDEYKFGFNAFVDHHPAAIKWIEEHDFYLCKLNIQSVIVLDWYGGPHYVPVLDYYRYKDAAANGANKEWTNSALWKRQTVTTDGGNDKRKVRIHLERDTNDLVIEM